MGQQHIYGGKSGEFAETYLMVERNVCLYMALLKSVRLGYRIKLPF